MRYRLVAAVFLACLAALGQTLSIDQLAKFLQSSVQLKTPDKEVANFLLKAKLKERLDDRAVEEMQGFGIGPKTLQALQALRDRSQALAAAAPVVADAKPAPIPPPSSEEQAAIVSEVREYSLQYSQSLPDYICTQVTRRYAAPAPGSKYGGSVDSEPHWQLLDTLQIRLSYFQQQEDYKLMLVNNSLTTQDYKALGGATSSGDFGSMMRQIFEHSTEARFEWDHWGTLRGRRVMAFAYRVEQARSQWHLTYDRAMDIMPAYRGLIEVDAKDHKVMRVTLHASDIPGSFPIKRAETILDYDYQDISGHTFLLPLKAQTIMAADNYLTRNDTEFRLYRKYSTDTNITFDTEAIPPLSDDKTKETKESVDCKDPKNAADPRCKK